ncbi:hypothetical protein TURU_156666 [Turdus rufiventris]|nr:hypothetical protein TURU_156666 [Turdus rufiventris]
MKEKGTVDKQNISFLKGEREGQRHWDRTDAQEVPPEYEEELLYCVGDCAQKQIAQTTVESPSLEMFKNSLDTILCQMFRDDPA